MAEVVTFENFRPPPRYDLLPWTSVEIEESVDVMSGWTQIDTIPLSPVDTDPTHPELRSFTTEHGTAIDYWYRVTFTDATGDTSQPTVPIQNTSAVSTTPPPVTAYATTDELFRLLKIRVPTADQVTAGQRVLDSAALEIDSEIGLDSPYTDPPALVVEVNLERAVEHWQQQEVPYGIWENALGPIIVGRDTWARHALKLSPLKQSWGVA
jgi:hypothetical protein